MFIAANPHVPNVSRLNFSQIIEQDSEMVTPRGCFGSFALLILLLLTLICRNNARHYVESSSIGWGYPMTVSIRLVFTLFQPLNLLEYHHKDHPIDQLVEPVHYLVLWIVYLRWLPQSPNRHHETFCIAPCPVSHQP
jgi:hypothetical protein